MTSSVSGQDRWYIFKMEREQAGCATRQCPLPVAIQSLHKWLVLPNKICKTECLCRWRAIVQLLFKCLYLDNYPSYLKQMFSLRSISYSLRGSIILTLPKPSTTSYGVNSLSYLACKLWNSLPDSHRKISGYNDFKCLVWNYNFM